ncbi:MAG: hypothetical protein HY429_03380 [Candidatus Levybacteria bacterium]|nr:hypothetical protein [Candidatus Levybacteria bacterium]
MPTTLKDLEITYDKPNWCPGCVVPNTFIQTNPSATLVANIKKNDKVIASDGKTHVVTETMSHIHNGVVYQLVSKYFGETTLTQEHPVLAVRRKYRKLQNIEFKSEWIEAGELQAGDYLLYPILKETRNIQTINLSYVRKTKDTKGKILPKQIVLSNSFLRLCGYYIAEGYVHRRSINLTFHIKEQEYADDVIQIMEEIFNLSSKKVLRKGKQTVDLSFNSSYLSEFFEEWFGKGAIAKKIPDFLMFLPKEKQGELIKGLWRGDGWVSQKTHRASFKTISKVLCEQVKVLLLRFGILPIISVYKAYGMHKMSYAIQLRDPYDFSLLAKILSMEDNIVVASRTRNLITSDFAFLPIKKIEKKKYKGPVYNMEVETENAYVSENAILHNCGDFGVWVSIKNAIVQLGLNPWEVVLVSGIGCSGKLPYWVKTYGFNGLHGRPMPPAEAIKLANHGLTVIVIGGDGDQYSEGANHLIHAMRRNINITLIVHNNQIYGLTTGQYSPTTDIGEKNKTTPVPTVEAPVNPMSLALAAGATFVARGFAGDNKQETELIVAGIKHKGFSIIDTMQPCVTFNHKNTFSWFYERVYKVEAQGHDPKNKQKAFALAEQWPLRAPLKEGEKEHIPTGILFQEDRPTWEDGIPQISQTPLVKQPLQNIDILPILKDLA